MNNCLYILQTLVFTTLTNTLPRRSQKLTNEFRDILNKFRSVPNLEEIFKQFQLIVVRVIIDQRVRYTINA